MPRGNCSFWKLATDLDKEQRSIAKTGAALFSYWNVNKLVEFEDLAVVLANALCLKFCLELCAVQVLGAIVGVGKGGAGAVGAHFVSCVEDTGFVDRLFGVLGDRLQVNVGPPRTVKFKCSLLTFESSLHT